MRHCPHVVRAVPAALLALSLLAGCGARPGDDAPARPVVVIQAEDARQGVRVFPGEVRARREAMLAFRVGGELVERHVDVGDTVVAGQVLAELDARDAALQVDAARARAAAADADLDVARAEHERYSALAARQLVSASIADAAARSLSAAQAQQRQARAELDLVSNQDRYTRLLAPADGVIAAREVEAGQVLAAGQAVFTLAEAGEREVLISVAEQERDAFAPGTPVRVALWSKPDLQVPGQVRERAPAADPASRTYAVRVGFDAAALGAELGQSARVYAAGNGPRSLRLPLTAVSSEDGQAFVWRLHEGRVQRQPVDVDSFDESGVQVRSGVEPGDWLVLGGVHLLRDGQPVQALDRANRPVDAGVRD